MTLNWKTRRKKKTSQQNTSNRTRTAPHPRTDAAASRGSNVRNRGTGCHIEPSSPRSIHYYGTVQTTEVADRASLCCKVPGLSPFVLLIAVVWKVTGKISALCRASKLKLLVSQQHTRYKISFARPLASGMYPVGPAAGRHDTHFLGFPLFRSKCWDVSQDSKLLLHVYFAANIKIAPLV